MRSCYVIWNNVWCIISLLQPCIYQHIYHHSWSCGVLIHLALISFSTEEIACSGSSSLQPWDDIRYGTCSGRAPFYLIYFSHTLLALWSTWRCSWCASIYAMTVGVFGVMLYSKMLGGFYHVVTMEILDDALKCILLDVVHYDVAHCFLWFPYVGILLLLFEVFDCLVCCSGFWLDIYPSCCLHGGMDDHWYALYFSNVEIY